MINAKRRFNKKGQEYFITEESELPEVVVTKYQTPRQNIPTTSKVYVRDTKYPDTYVYDVWLPGFNQGLDLITPEFDILAGTKWLGPLKYPAGVIGAKVLGLIGESADKAVGGNGAVGETIGNIAGFGMGANPRFVFHNLPYKQLYKTVAFGVGALREVKPFLKSSPFELPQHIRSRQFAKLRRDLRKHPQVQIKDATLSYSTRTGLDMEVFNQRLAGQYDPEMIPVKDYLSVRDAYNLIRSDWNSKFASALWAPALYLQANINPGAAFTYSKNPLIILNPKALKDIKFNVGTTQSHEIAHILRNHWLGDQLPSGAFNFKHLSPRISKYFTDNDYDEILARGTLLKNYFGIIDDTPITGDMLKYGAKHYIKDTGVNNNMDQFFSSIKDWDKAAEYISKFSK